MGLKRLFRNIKYIMKKDLTNIIDIEEVKNVTSIMMDNLKYELREDLENIINNNHKLVFLICGPVATALAYDLCKLNLGIQAIDIGHLAKDYDYYINKRPRTIDSTKKFFESEE